MELQQTVAVLNQPVCKARLLKCKWLMGKASELQTHQLVFLCVSVVQWEALLGKCTELNSFGFYQLLSKWGALNIHPSVTAHIADVRSAFRTNYIKADECSCLVQGNAPLNWNFIVFFFWLCALTSNKGPILFFSRYDWILDCCGDAMKKLWWLAKRF